MLMQTVKLDPQDYDGSQLHHALAYEQGGVLGPTISWFIGAADVKDHLVDLEDSLSNDFIKSDEMVHFIIEIPNIGIQEAVVWQRLFIRMIATHIKEYADNCPRVVVEGDDIMVTNRKLSVSIATLSRFSGLIHVGINTFVGDNCPVPAIGLTDFGVLNSISADIWAERRSINFANEFNDIVNATYKVIEVK